MSDELCAYCGEPSRAGVPLCTECYILFLDAQSQIPEIKIATMMLMTAGVMQGKKGGELKAFMDDTAEHYMGISKKIDRWLLTHKRAWGK